MTPQAKKRKKSLMGWLDKYTRYAVFNSNKSNAEAIRWLSKYLRSRKNLILKKEEPKKVRITIEEL